MPTRDRRRPLWLLIGPFLGMVGVTTSWASTFRDERAAPVWLTVLFGFCGLCFLITLALVLWGRRRAAEAGHSR